MKNNSVFQLNIAKLKCFTNKIYYKIVYIFYKYL
ncbi:hypothetical protein BE25_0177 [Staphylococcus phage vB_SepM_BE25]|nr:hypothetical protein BE24_0146 [Staphylococcus phage vB_SepM_BE24]WEU70663.1 hypothetical protein BE25_0177 [Staphylococcus phage vB_SepM_BE25]